MAVQTAARAAQDRAATASARGCYAAGALQKKCGGQLSDAQVETVVACDEGRFGLKTWLRRRWALLGERPPWVVQDAYEWVWLYVAVEPSSGKLICWLFPSVDSACLTAFLHAVRAEFREERVGVVLDNAPSHRSQQVIWPEGCVSLPLPPYSPELNPAEQVFRHLRKQLANQVFVDLEALQAALTHALEELWSQPAVVVRLTAYPWWHDGAQNNLPLVS